MDNTKNKKLLLVKYLNHSGDKTIRVIKETIKQHPIYKKYIKTSSKYMVHFDSKDTLNEGDYIYIQFVRPISKTKSYNYVKKYEKVDL